MQRKPHENLDSFIATLKSENEIDTVTAAVDPHLEIAEIHRKTVENRGKALLFTNVKGSSFPVTTNLFGSEKRMELAFPDRPEKLIQDIVHLLTGSLPPSIQTLWKKRTTLLRLISLGTKKGVHGPITECSMQPCDLHKLPLLTCWIDDGGPFITLPLVYTEGVQGRKKNNLGMYRIQRFESRLAGLHFQIAKGGGFHYFEAEQKNQPLPVSIFLGGPPALMLAAIAPLPENVSELLFASLLLGSKIETVQRIHPHSMIAQCEFAIQGYAKPHERRLEGPFGDHYGYYGMAHEFPTLHIESIYHRKRAIYPATVVGKPIQEDYYIGNYLQKLLHPLIPMVMPSVVALWSYPESGFHPLAAAQIKERYEKEALTTAFRILGEGQLALTKFLLLTDEAVDLTDCKAVLETVLSKCSFDDGFYLFTNTSNDTLDYTGPRLNKGSKAVLLGVGPEKRKLPEHLSAMPPQPIANAVVFCKGVLVIDGDFDAYDITCATTHELFRNWPLIILVDNARQATSSSLEFLWTVFTRFEPQSDIYPRKTSVFRHHTGYEFPLLIDARMKSRYPKEAIVDPATKELVERRWHEYNIRL